MHIGAHVVDRETLIDYRVEHWALERERRWIVGWADSLREAVELAESEDAERLRKLNQQPPTHPRGLAG